MLRAESVYSPAAYLVDLLTLLEGSFDRPSLLGRRPDLKQVVLDAENTFTEMPYLDIVNQVLGLTTFFLLAYTQLGCLSHCARSS